MAFLLSAQPTPSVFRATGDALASLGEASRIGLALSADELHCFCYFGRCVGQSVLVRQTEDAYAFTYSERGGPFSSDLQTALETLVSEGFALRSPIGEAGSATLEKYLADSSLGELAELLDAVVDPANGAAFIVATVRACLLRPLPLVFNAIHREPSLYLARTQELHSGLPLPTRSEEFAAWLAAVSGEVEKIAPGRGKEPAALVPIVLDLLGHSITPDHAAHEGDDGAADVTEDDGDDDGGGDDEYDNDDEGDRASRR